MQYICNITTNIEESIESLWLSWMGKLHSSGKLAPYGVQKILMTHVEVGTEEMGGVTYSVQYFFDSKEDREYFMQHPELCKQDMPKEFISKCVDFATPLKIIHTYASKNG